MSPLVRAAALAAAGLLAGCVALPPEEKPAAPAPAPAPTPAAPAPAAAGKGRLKPMPVRPLQVQAECRFKDETGYTGRALLDVDDNQVKAFAASIDIPRRGSCRFDLARFRQVKATAHVHLAGDKGCTVRMWEQGEQVTVAFSQCAAYCTGNTADYLWPILVDRPSGRCD